MPVLLAASKGSSGGASFTPFLLIIVLIVIGYFVLIRPQRNRQRQAQQMQHSLEVGAEVMTTAGLYGTVTSIDDDTVTLEVSPGVHNRFVRAAIARVVTPVEPEVIAASEPVDTSDEPTEPTEPTEPAHSGQSAEPADSGNRRDE